MAITGGGQILFGMRTALWVSVFAVSALSAVCVEAAIEPHILILNGQFGTLGDKHKLTITSQLQQLCGIGSERCDVFCSETTFGLYRLGRKPICRVTYRCADGVVRSAEAAREEPIMLRCDEESDAADNPAAADDQPVNAPRSAR